MITSISSTTFEAVSPEVLDSLLDLFSEVTRIEALSKKERLIADFIRNRVLQVGCSVTEDEAGSRIGGNSGNVFVYPPQYDATKPAIVFSAHMDTARNTGNVTVIRHSDRITSDGNQQLGVDNRAGLSILLYLLENQQSLGIENQNYFCVFTIAEEIGLLGAYQADFSTKNVKAVYVFDSAMRPGNYIAECAGMFLFEVSITGKAAHSAVAPEKGTNAVKAASAMINALPVGRIEPFTTANIGLISGGESTNIIPESCRFEGEIRSLNLATIQHYLKHFEVTCEKIALEKGVNVQFKAVKDFSPYQIAAESPIRFHLENAMRHIGLTPNPVRYTGGSDANVYNEKGIPAINLGVGAQNPHGNDEFMLYEDFKTVLTLALALLSIKEEV